MASHSLPVSLSFLFQIDNDMCIYFIALDDFSEANLVYIEARP